MERLWRVCFHVAAPTISGHAEYEVWAEDEARAIAVARRRAANDWVPTQTATVEVELIRGGEDAS